VTLPAELVIITISGEDADQVAAEIGQVLEDLRDSGEWATFDWQIKTVTVTGKGNAS
jgi:hypothetical protein